MEGVSEVKQVLGGAPEEGAVGLEIGVGEALEGPFPGGQELGGVVTVAWVLQTLW